MDKNSNELSISEKNALINTIRGNNIEEANEAWEELYKEFEAQIETIIKDSIWHSIAKDYDKHARLAGWLGFVDKIKAYNSDKADLYISIINSIQMQMDKHIDYESAIPHVLNHKAKVVSYALAWMARMDAEDNHHIVFAPKSNNHYVKKYDYEDLGKYTDERLSIQIAEVLRKFSDEYHQLSCDDLYFYLEVYRAVKYGNSSKPGSRNAFLKSVAETLNELGHDRFSMKDKEAYVNSVEMKKTEPQQVENAPGFEDISYNHLLKYNSLDHLIQIIYFSNVLSESKKNDLVSKLFSTTSVYYENPFWSKTDRRFISDYQNRTDEQSCTADNITIIQNAINLLAQISFKYNRYTANKEIETVSEITVSPYHLIIYQGYYYLICAKENDDKVSHLRVDLMSDIVMESYADGIPVPIDILPFEGLPLFNPDWNPDRYAAEHLYMASDTPIDIHMRVSSKDSTIYTLIHDWFGNYYEVIKNTDETDFETIIVKTSPSVIVSFAIQYPNRIEVLNEEIRKEIRNKANEIYRKYE